ncbi:hypothetical protein DSCA_06350 [Desulfosarcina alkanivorans]|uniref:DUF3783 domain-containing protein n=1 Tax=Desulfosarcina alkanivorans TaxID=571177 RepID=A0A5K7YE37_9BACT|nr:DUF3783 domain-containing protein [Desulfosarcina alkanivorans]BBO66705.1 hypothetical protein DSCA_06350 [Desulfosarcina alkanivorans]
MTDGTFERVQHSDDRMYGPTKLLLCGFSGAAQPKFKAVLKMAGLGDTEILWANESHEKTPLTDLLALPDGNGAGKASELPRAIIVSGITQNQLHGLMNLCRKTGMQQSLWAALTPTSETWALARLLTELQAERKALSGRRKKK